MLSMVMINGHEKFYCVLSLANDDNGYKGDICVGSQAITTTIETSLHIVVYYTI